jgi:hypothetical protein
VEKEERSGSIFGWITAVTVGAFYLLFAWALPFPVVNQLNRCGPLRSRLRREDRKSNHKKR